MRRTLPYAAALVIVGGLGLGAAQTPAQLPVSHPALSGLWVLADANPGGGKADRQVEEVPMGGAPRPGTGATDGAGSGSGGGRGGFVPTSTTDAGGIGGLFTDWGDRLPSTKPKRLTATEAMRKELLTPPEAFSIDLSASTATIDDGASGPVTYKINGKSEAHQLANGSIKTKTSWFGSQLRQVIDGGRKLRLVRILELAEDGQLRLSIEENSGQTSRRSIYKRKG